MSSKRIDGRALAQEIAEHLSEIQLKKTLHIFVVGSNPVITSFVKQKMKFGKLIASPVEVINLPETISQDELIALIKSSQSDGIIVQLPLPIHMETQEILNSIPTGKDVDVLSEDSYQLFEEGTDASVPPVARAVAHILQASGVEVAGARIAIVGKGRLVGHPTALLLKRMGGDVSVIDTKTLSHERSSLLLEADVVISGTGVPNSIVPSDVKDGVVLIDAGTSSSKGTLVGDIARNCEEKAKLICMSPGGVGPLTVACVFLNLYGVSTTH